MGDQPRYPLRRFAVSLLPFRIGLLPEPVANPAVGEAVEERLQRLVCQVVGPGFSTVEAVARKRSASVTASW